MAVLQVYWNGAFTAVVTPAVMWNGVWTKSRIVYVMWNGVWTLVYPTLPGQVSIGNWGTYTCSGSSCGSTVTFNLSLNAPVSGGNAPDAIYLTTDGSLPTTASAAYANGGTAAFTIGRNTAYTISTRAFNSAGYGPLTQVPMGYTWSSGAVVPSAPTFVNANSPSCNAGSQCPLTYTINVTINCSGATAIHWSLSAGGSGTISGGSGVVPVTVGRNQTNTLSAFGSNGVGNGGTSGANIHYSWSGKA